jgi:acyl-CoA reductase-like NAD-dependent aldehyde dehydrogenase
MQSIPAPVLPDILSKKSLKTTFLLHRYGLAGAEVNASTFGLQAGVFTRDLYKAQRAWEELEVGGVVVGDVPSWRVDHMPYGGVKDSGLGREGVRFAIEDMTEIRNLVIRNPRRASR